ncbi:hypothetical protein HOY82DRAFT_648542 [Tuber indicum]|nr:hypothetical protein HOY82DRAFT_648542 [Tuber indicum]
MVHAMLGSLSQSVKEGKSGENGFKKEAWQKTRIATNTVYGTKLDLTQCKTKYASLKADYCTFHKLRENLGFGWNEENGIPTAAEGVWDEYIAKHPEAAKFRQKPFTFYAEMDEILLG